MAVAAGITQIITGAEKSRRNRSAIQKSSREQVEAAGDAFNNSQRVLNENLAALEPFRATGFDALNEQRALLGFEGEEAGQEAIQRFSESPGQQFLRDRGEKALLRNSAALGGIGGGNVRSALVEQGVGFAQQDFNNQFNRLDRFRNQGFSAVNRTGKIREQGGRDFTNLRGQLAQQRAAGILGVTQARNQFLDSFSKGVGTAVGGG